ncbi:MAG: cytochrome C [Geobacter sp.]|jgi:hypothetical protein
MRYPIITLITCLLITSRAEAFECKVCHSKNPAMVAMHTALRGQGCFGCHKPGEKLMGKGQPKDRDSLLKRRQADELCLPCHRQTTDQQTKD